MQRAERVNKDGEESPARLTIAQVALLNMCGQELREADFYDPAHQSLPDRLPIADFPNTHLSPTGLNHLCLL